LSCVGRKRDNPRKFRSRVSLSKPNLFIGPWLVAIVRASDFHAQRDRLREKVTDDGPAFKLPQGSAGRGLFARAIRHPVHKRLHKRGADDVDRNRPKGIRALGKSKLAAPNLPRCRRVALKLGAPQERADNRGEAPLTDLRCAKRPASCHF
jgi:hypothetical protein